MRWFFIVCVWGGWSEWVVCVCVCVLGVGISWKMRCVCLYLCMGEGGGVESEHCITFPGGEGGHRRTYVVQCWVKNKNSLLDAPTNRDCPYHLVNTENKYWENVIKAYNLVVRYTLGMREPRKIYPHSKPEHHNTPPHATGKNIPPPQGR